MIKGKCTYHKMLLAFTTVLITHSANATLIDRGLFDDGLGGQTRLIYDDVQNITWVGDANFALTAGLDPGEVQNFRGDMRWTTAMNLAEAQTIGGFNDWRLPLANQFDPTCSIQVYLGFEGQSAGANCSGSEMGHLFHVDNVSYWNQGLFENIQGITYFTGTEFDPYIGDSSRYAAINFEFGSGGTGLTGINKHALGALMLVRDGDVAEKLVSVPEPGTGLLFTLGLFGLIGMHKKAKRVV